MASPSDGGEGSSSAGGVGHGGAEVRLSCERLPGVSGALAALIGMRKVRYIINYFTFEA